MDPKFIFVLFAVELGSLIFNSLHTAAPEFHVYNAYDELPIIYPVAEKPYSCFQSVNYCIYEHKQLRFLKGLDLFFISMIVVFYGCLFFIILNKSQNIKVRSNLRITWYAGLQLLAVLMLALHMLLMVILYERNNVNTEQCNKQNRLMRVENLFNYFALSILEVAYISFDLVNRQTLPFRVPHQEFESKVEAEEHLRLPATRKNYVIAEAWNY